MPSGRWMDSTLITSAPIAARNWVAKGPAQNAVKSMMRRPASGPPPSGPRGSPPAAAPSRHSAASAPGRGAGVRGRSSASASRYGGRGWTKAAPGWGTKAPRATKWSKVVTVSPVPIAATGMRSAAARSTISATVCRRVQPWIIAFTSGARRMRSSQRASAWSSTRSGRSMRTRKSRHCCAVMVQKPIQPSRAGSMDGISTVRANGPGRPARLSHTIVLGAMVSAITSSRERSTCSPRPSRRAPCQAASATAAAYAPPSHSPSRPPAASGGRSVVPRAAVEPHHACSVNSVAGRRLHGPPRPKGEMETTVTRRFRCHTAAGPEAEVLDRARREALDHDVGAGGEVEDPLAPLGARVVDGGGAFRRVEEAEEDAVLAGIGRTSRRAPAPQWIAGARALDLQHVGARVGEQLGAVRSGDLGRQVEDPDAGERSRHSISGRAAGPGNRSGRRSGM